MRVIFNTESCHKKTYQLISNEDMLNKNRSILAPTLFLLYINELPDDFICNIAIYTDDDTLYSKCDQAPDLWQQLELASELESDLRDTVEWGRKWLVDFNV